jgi:hypothetical protein
VTERRRYQREVERLKVRGARGPALREPKRELSRARKELAAIVAAGSN